MSARAAARRLRMPKNCGVPCRYGFPAHEEKSTCHNQNEERPMRAAKSIVAACLLGGVLLPLQAADLPKQGKFTAKFGWYAVGKVFELEKDHIFWVGEFSGTVFNDAGSGFMHLASLVCPGSNDIHLDGQQGRADGYCVMTDKEGDKLYSVWS